MDPQETKIFMVISITTILVGGSFLYLFILLFNEQRKNVKLQRQLALAEISSLEEEQARIAADLHDDLGPLLSAIKFRVTSVNTKTEEDQEEIRVSSKLLDDAILRLRQISNGLLPTSLLRKGLFEAIEELINITGQKNGLKIAFEYDQNIVIPKEKQIHFFRMAQESIQNSIKHAKASRLLLVLKKEGQLLHFRITDNGCGIITKEPKTEGGRGLVSLSNRANIMGGYLHIHSEANKGTILDFEIPL